MQDEISRKAESRLDKKMARRRSLDDGFKKGKVVNEVLDKPTVMTLYKMITSHVMAYVNGAVSAGKESVLFWAVGEDGSDIALKVYLVSASNFKRRWPYVEGDPRFARPKKGTRNMVQLWAKKEFRNLSQCYDRGIAVPRPIFQTSNVLAMSFVGTGGRPAARLVDSEADARDYAASILLLRRLYREAGLVHGDFSEFNIFKTEGGLVAFDFGSAVDLRHPNASGFLKRDINNIIRFFSKRGVQVDDPRDVFEGIVR